MLLKRPLTQQTLVFWGQIWFPNGISNVVVFSEHLLCLNNMEMRDRSRNAWQCYVQSMQFITRIFRQVLYNASHNLCEQRHDGEVIFDKPKFNIQTDILVDVTCRGMLLCPEYGADFVNTLEDANHNLLVELRALGEISR